MDVLVNDLREDNPIVLVFGKHGIKYFALGSFVRSSS